jgi:hypothetical protein
MRTEYHSLFVSRIQKSPSMVEIYKNLTAERKGSLTVRLLSILRKLNHFNKIQFFDGNIFILSGHFYLEKNAGNLFRAQTRFYLPVPNFNYQNLILVASLEFNIEFFRFFQFLGNQNQRPYRKTEAQTMETKRGKYLIIKLIN